MHFLKIAFALIFSIAFQNVTLIANADSLPPYYTKTTLYPNTDNYCLYQGEWSGDLSKASLKYLLVVQSSDQRQFGDIFVGFRQKSVPDQLWLLGFGMNASGATTQAGWVLYNPKQVPVVYAMGQTLPATTRVNILDKPTDISHFQGDGEIFVGYGLRKNNSSTSPADSFNEMLEHNKFTSIWQINNQQPVNFGYWICFKFAEITERIDGFEPSQ